MEASRFSVLESVRCLECGEVYSKPAAGGTTQKNPGCPVCGYVGWIPAKLGGLSAPAARARSGAGLQPFRPVRWC